MEPRSSACLAWLGAWRWISGVPYRKPPTYQWTKSFCALAMRSSGMTAKIMAPMRAAAVSLIQKSRREVGYRRSAEVTLGMAAEATDSRWKCMTT